MISVQNLLYVFVGLITISPVDGGSFYDTPQLDDQFVNFRITNPISRAGSAAGGDIQEPVNLGSNYVIFEFKGKGNALLLFQEDGTNETHNVCLVEIGGGELFRTIGVYKSKIPGESKVGGSSVSGITSDDEFRPFWIRWFDGLTNIYLGRGYEPGESQFYGTANALTFPVNTLSISTSRANNGSWHFNIGEVLTSVSLTSFETVTNYTVTSGTAVDYSMIPTDTTPAVTSGQTIEYTTSNSGFFTHSTGMIVTSVVVTITVTTGACAGCSHLAFVPGLLYNTIWYSQG